MSVAQCPVMPAPSHTHNKHTPSSVRPNHTAQREHINYRCTLNYFHYLSCSVDGTETEMMDGKGFATSPRVASAPSFKFSNPFPALLFFMLHQFRHFFWFLSLFVSLLSAVQIFLPRMIPLEQVISCCDTDWKLGDEQVGGEAVRVLRCSPKQSL